MQETWRAILILVTKVATAFSRNSSIPQLNERGADQMGAGCGRCIVGVGSRKGTMMVEKTLRAAMLRVSLEIREGVESINITASTPQRFP